MSQPRLWPFRRVSVDNMVRGVTRVWWQLEPTFNEPGPRVFQLQVGNTGLRDAIDWRNVGAPVTDGYLAHDDAWRATGSDLVTHYRVTLTTNNEVYISQAVNCFGELSERDWVLAREVLRKEQLRHKYVSVDGYLLKPYRFGRPCKKCRDELTGETLDSNCVICNGCGLVTVDHNYGGPDHLAYRDATGFPVVGATIWVFPIDIFADANPDYPDRAQAIAVTATRTNGRWTDALQLDPGGYAVLFEKPGEYGPDVYLLDVVATDTGSSAFWVSPFAVLGDSSMALNTETSEPEGVVTEGPVRLSPQDYNDDFWNF